jgi:hypothetical protein
MEFGGLSQTVCIDPLFCILPVLALYVVDSPALFISYGETAPIDRPFQQ